ncbi:MAG: ABC transporter substrate-binding protein [Armatimonadota bacterium]|nr:ABC transporter substrate-binding protein [Armatimonadota bacterium]
MTRRFLAGILLTWAALLGLLGLLVSGSLDGAGVGSGPASGRKQQKDVVTFWVGELIGARRERATRKAVDDYNRRHKDVYVDAVVMPYACYLGKINVAIATGQPPDVCVNAVRQIDGLRVKQKIPDLAVPVPDDMMPEEVRRRYGKNCISGVSRRGRIYLFPSIKYLFGGVLRGNRLGFEKAGVDIDYYVANGWDYKTFRREMKKVQAALRREMGEEAYALGIGLTLVDEFLYSRLLPNAVGKEVAEREFLYYDKSRGRYVLDPAMTPRKLAAPMLLMQQLINVDHTWSRKSLGLDFAQQGNDCDKRGLAAVIWADTPGSAGYAQAEQMDERRRGLRSGYFRTANVPIPTPRKGMPLVFRAGADGYGVMRQIPYKGDKHTRHALEFARYLTSPEVQAKVMMAARFHVNPWPDEEAVVRCAKGYTDPIQTDPGLRRQWALYLKWLNSSNVVAPNRVWPDQDAREQIQMRINGFISGAGHQILEQVLYDRKKPSDAAKQILAGLKDAIDGYYRERGAEGL